MHAGGSAAHLTGGSRARATAAATRKARLNRMDRSEAYCQPSGGRFAATVSGTAACAARAVRPCRGELSRASCRGAGGMCARVAGDGGDDVSKKGSEARAAGTVPWSSSMMSMSRLYSLSTRSCCVVLVRDGDVRPAWS
eukprot:6206027-Pleurochrysis_carterae.AAC.6